MDKRQKGCGGSAMSKQKLIEQQLEQALSAQIDAHGSSRPFLVSL